MANRPDNFSPTVTTETPLEPDTSTLTNAVFSIGDGLAQASAQTKALQATAQTSNQFRTLDQQFRQQYADDPTNQKGLQDLQAARQKIVDQNSSNVPTIAQRDYTNKTIELGQQSDVSNELWAGKQQARNVVNNLNTAQNSYYLQANADGRNFAANGGGDINDALSFVQANATMQQFANPVIGADKTGKLLDNFNSNYVKSFVAGVAESQPALAASLLQDPNIKQHFTTQDLDDMGDVIKKTQRAQNLSQQLSVSDNDAKLPTIINDPNTSYFEKRSAIDQMDAAGQISTKAAASARRVIKSNNDLDSQTDTGQMSEVIKETYDLNANSKMDADTYLTGVRDIQQKILDLQATNQLTGGDAKKLTDQVTQLTNKRMSDATRTAGTDFGDANDKFNTLPPEYRGDATRALFYSQYNQNMTPQQISNQADKIIDDINVKRRAQALSIVSQTANDDVFLQAAGYTRAQVADTAANRNLSQAQVISALRAKYAVKPKHGLNKMAPAQDEENNSTSGGIHLNGPNPAGIEQDEDDENEK